MVSAYLQMAETSPNVYTFVTRYSAGDADGSPRPIADGRRPRATSLTPSRDMIATPMRTPPGADGTGSRDRLLAQRRHRPGAERRRTVARPVRLARPSRTRKPWRGRSPTGCASASPPSSGHLEPQAPDPTLPRTTTVRTNEGIDMTEVADRPGPATTQRRRTASRAGDRRQADRPRRPAVDVAALGELLLGRWADIRRQRPGPGRHGRSCTRSRA